MTNVCIRESGKRNSGDPTHFMYLFKLWLKYIYKCGLYYRQNYHHTDSRIFLKIQCFKVLCTTQSERVDEIQLNHKTNVLYLYGGAVSETKAHASQFKVVVYVRAMQ